MFFNTGTIFSSSLIIILVGEKGTTFRLVRGKADMPPEIQKVNIAKAYWKPGHFWKFYGYEGYQHMT